MTHSYRVSVVIPTYRRCAAVQRLLEHLARQTAAADEYEVIVSIDGADDDTREMVGAFRAPYALHTLCRPHGGRAAACNAGIVAARGELVVLLDDDMAPVPEFLRAHQEAHAVEPRLGVLGAVPIIVPPDAPPVAAYVAAKFNRLLEKLARPDHVFALRDFYSGNFSIRRDLLLEVGLFDEAFKIYGNEDLDLSLRLVRAGIRLRYRAGALAHQSYTKTFPELARDTIAKGHTAVQLAGKHPEAFHELKLATFDGASRRWRYARNALLSFSATFPPTATGVVKLVTAVERRRPRRLHLLYDFALDYLYWLGAAQALGAGGLRQLAARAPRGLPDPGGSDTPSRAANPGNRPLVSVVIPTHNRPALLKEALDSVYAQKEKREVFELEVVVVDDASSDSTPDVVLNYPEVRYLRLPTRKGPGVARNAGIAATNGSYIAFLDDDDVWLPVKLSLQVPVLERNPEVCAVCSEVQEQGREWVWPSVHPAPVARVFHRLLLGNFYGNPAGFLLRRWALEAVGGFDESLSLAEDYDLWLRLAARFPFAFVPGVVALCRPSPTASMLPASSRGTSSKLGDSSSRTLLPFFPTTPPRVARNGKPDWRAGSI